MSAANRPPARLLALDPSLTATGLAVLELGPVGEVVLETDVIRPASPDQAVMGLYQAERDGLRVDEIAKRLIAVVRHWKPTLVAMEAYAGAQDANAIKALALAAGVIRGVLGSHDLRPIMVQARHAKAAATGQLGASKTDVVEAMAARFGPIDGPKVRREAVADALAVACVALELPAVVQARGQPVARGITPGRAKQLLAPWGIYGPPPVKP